MHEVFLKASSKAKTVFEVKVKLEKIMGHFSAGSINKAVPSFRKRLKEYVKADGGQFSSYFNSQSVHTQLQCLHTVTVFTHSYSVCLHCLELRQFLTTPKLLRCGE